MKDRRNIDEFLAAIASRRRQGLLLALLFRLSLWLLIQVTVGILWGEAFLRHPWWRVVDLVGCALLLLWALRPSIALFRRMAPETLALFVERACPQLENRLISAVEFSRRLQRGEFPYSPVLAVATIQRARREISTLDPDRFFDLRAGRRRLGVALTLLGVGVVLLLLLPPAKRRAFLALYHAPLFAPPTPEGKRLETIGEITLDLRFPRYSGLEDVHLAATSGEIAALKGTEATVTLRTPFPVKRSILILRGDEEREKRIPMTVTASDLAQGRFTLLAPGSYTIQIENERGEIFEDPRARTIEILPDAPPSIELLAPEHDLELHDGEILEIDYHAEDDFGLSRLRIVYDTGEGEKVEEIAAFGDQRETRGRYTWDLGRIETLEPGRPMTFQLEVEDNDVVSGPKKTRSAPRRVTILDAAAHHEALQADLETIFEGLLLLLADEIETPVTNERSALERRQTGILSTAETLLVRFERLLTAMRDDPLTDAANYYALENVKASFSERFRESRRYFLLDIMNRADQPVPQEIVARVEAQRTAEIEELEHDILFVLTIMEREKLQNVAETADALSDAQQRLSELMSRLEEGEERGVSDEIRRILDDIGTMLADIGHKLSEMSKTLPDEFLNEEALHEIDLADLQKTMAQIDDLLSEGKIEEALRALENLQGKLSELMSRLDEAARSFAFDDFEAVFREVEGSLSEIDEIIGSQRQLLEAAEKVERQIEAKRLEHLGESAESFVKRQLERVARIREHLEATRSRFSEPLTRQAPPGLLGTVLETLQERVVTALNGAEEEAAFLEDLLEAHAFDESLGSAYRARTHLLDLIEQLRSVLRARGERSLDVSEIRSAQGLLDRIIHDLERLLQSPPQLGEEAAGEVGRQSTGEERLAERTRRLGRRLRKLTETSPFVPRNLPEQVGEAADEMARATGNLQRPDVKGAIRDEREAISRLGQARASLEQLKDQMSGAGNDAPLGWGRRSPPGAPPGWWGMDDHKVEIPSEEQYRVPKNFREDILEAMKRDAPERYRRLIEEYYENLVR
ncbi:MAG: DUF4175 family protein [Deltaproteobacteria bacterium]|nr:MAG: DUF4175 family protein [Deltaproteobacteria bacterium]